MMELDDDIRKQLYAILPLERKTTRSEAELTETSYDVAGLQKLVGRMLEMEAEGWKDLRFNSYGDYDGGTSCVIGGTRQELDAEYLERLKDAVARLAASIVPGENRVRLRSALFEAMYQEALNTVKFLTSPLPFRDLVGTRHAFYGVDAEAFKLGSRVFEAIVDPDDGYRSCLRDVVETDRKCVFFRQPLEMVTIKDSGVIDDGWDLVADDGHVWLTFGTDHSDDYYPSFIFSYTPRRDRVGVGEMEEVNR